MPEEEKMTMDERFKYLRLMKKRYLKAGKLERGRLLDEMEAVTRLHRKSLIRLMSSSLERKPRQKQRDGGDVVGVLFQPPQERRQPRATAYGYNFGPAATLPVVIDDVGQPALSGRTEGG